MRKIIVGMIGIIILSACGTPSPDVENPTPNPVEAAPSPDAITPADPTGKEPPPLLTTGTFTLHMPSSINEFLFEENDAGDFSVFGALEMEGLIYLYLHNRGSIYYAVSSDGSDWALSPEPIFTGLYNDDFEYFPASIHATQEGYAIYCGAETVDYAEHDFLYSIWTLTAPEPTGPWDLREYPSLIGWYTGREEEVPYYVVHPIVRPYLEGFRMYFAYTFTLEGIETPEFATAHSWDGLSWRYTPDLPTPEMTQGTYSLIFAEDYDWSGLLVLDVWPTELGWQMLYRLDEDEGGWAQIYLADSEDGLQWTPSEVDIQLPQDQSAEDIVSASTLYFQNQYFLTYCAMPQSHEYQCYIVANDLGT
jgi:hypothetical protein